LFTALSPLLPYCKDKFFTSNKADTAYSLQNILIIGLNLLQINSIISFPLAKGYIMGENTHVYPIAFGFRQKVVQIKAK
jgi:hypothetical protein